MSLSLFPSFYDRPEKIKFLDQEEGERIELFLRQHWITTVPWIFVVVLMSLVPILLIRFKTFSSFLGIPPIPPDVGVALIVLWYMLTFAYLIQHVLYWYFNIYMVTSLHLIDIDFQNLQSLDRTEARLDDVQSARSRFRGILGPLFNYGDVVVETAAEKQNIDFVVVPKPDLVRERIQDLQLQQEKKGPIHAG